MIRPKPPAPMMTSFIVTRYYSGGMKAGVNLFATRLAADDCAERWRQCHPGQKAEVEEVQQERKLRSAVPRHGPRNDGSQ